MSPAGVMRQPRAWSGYSQAEASISSAGGVIGEEDYSSSDTEVGDQGRPRDTPFAGKESEGDEMDPGFETYPGSLHFRENGSNSSDQEVSSSALQNGDNLRHSTSGSVSTLMEQERHGHHTVNRGHIPSGFTLKERFGDATTTGVKRNRSPMSRKSTSSAEEGLLMGSVVLIIWRLHFEMGARREALELSMLMVLVWVYLRTRSTSFRLPESQKQGLYDPLVNNIHVVNLVDVTSNQASHDIGVVPHVVSRFVGSGISGSRNRKIHEQTTTGRISFAPAHQNVRNENANKSTSPSKCEHSSLGGRGLVWATADRNYRECIDDGAAFALLLGPILASSMFYTTWRSLIANPTQARTAEWNIEQPMILDSTPLPLSAQLGSLRLPSTLNERHPAVLALTALCLSRQHLVHLTCLLSLILIVHAVCSRSTDIAHLKRDPSSAGKDVNMGGARWIKHSEWKRSWAIISFSFAVTAFFVVVKAIADMLRLSEGYDLTNADIIIATLFFQFSLYVCIRLARRGFTLGELGVVCHAATGLFMETVNLTRTRLALIPGSLLTGFLLSPLLVLSRKIAQKPAHRLRHPHEKELYRKALALGFYMGAAAICGGLIGFWVKWLLGWRDPWVWVAFWLTEGRHWWSRPILLAYWGLLAAISVGGWTRQLNRARKRRAWSEATNTNGHSKISIHNSTAQAAMGTRQHSRKAGAVMDPGFGQVATQMLDAANQKLPVLSINARRKFFHALATVMFIPGIAIDPAFTHLAFSLAFAAFNFAEYIRYFALYPFGAAVHLFLNEFLDESKDGGTAILSHFYLLTGCASGVWLEGPKTILSIFGALALGIGDALASIVGKRIGRLRWSTSSGKTVEGTGAFVVSVVFTGSALMLGGFIGEFSTYRNIVESHLETGTRALGGTLDTRMQLKLPQSSADFVRRKD
ncbi:hypothetical protein QFC21_001338 [Naganishia friedmannii]|uniref:Uncharacterized protein n=1 Tax=Naganishia friedmannii TaxID=89922 RepID=A0ACC2W389_9TREE|nr:hypothetical protein QFC21_001338 [Naganishia friedmannii]